jgi:hypothetical protein
MSKAKKAYFFFVKNIRSLASSEAVEIADIARFSFPIPEKIISGTVNGGGVELSFHSFEGDIFIRKAK